ncbi:MAG: hypothetical protein M3Y59_20425 [Myxococcota bacterium]|nr:hypothetical protein [Myxococcota bacterium]
MAEPQAQALVAAVNALYRIRAVEQPPGEDGLRSVWHQCAQGADLVSQVDGNGRVVRQELTLLSDFFRWTSQQGLITGRTGERSGRGQKACGELELDPQILPARVLRAAQALASYQGDDRYIRNIQRVLNLVVTGLQSYEEVTVTHAQNQPLERPAASPPAKPHAPLALIIAVLLVALAVGVTWLLMA